MKLIGANPESTHRSDEAGVVGGLTVLIMAIPLLLLSGLTLFNSRLSQTDHDLAWAATSAARAGASCVRLSPDEASQEPCTLQEVGQVVEETIRSLLLSNRRLFCLNTNSTGMVVEYQDYEGQLIYAYAIGSVLLHPAQWPDGGTEKEVETPKIFGDPAKGMPPDEEALSYAFFPLHPSERRDFQGEPLTLNPNTSNVNTGFAATMLEPLGSDEPVGRIQVNLLCDYAQGATSRLAQCAGLSRNADRNCEFAEGTGQFLSRASSREASATAVVPPFEFSAAT